MDIFSHIFFVLAIKSCRMHLFQNRFHQWSTFWPYFPGTPVKVQLMAIIGRAITPNMAILVIMGVMVRPIMAISLTFMSVPGKYGQNVDHQWKRFWKRLILRNFMAKTKKCEKKWPFLGNFLCKIGQILKLMARVTGCSKNPEIFFGCSSYIYTAMDKLPGWNSNFYIFCDRLIPILTDSSGFPGLVALGGSTQD